MKVYVKLDIVEEMHAPHAMTKRLETIEIKTFDLPDEECMEVRPDWGKYSPVVTFPAIERALQKRHAFPYVEGLNRNRIYSYGIVN